MRSHQKWTTPIDKTILVACALASGWGSVRIVQGGLTLVREADVEVLMLPDRYTLLDQSARHPAARTWGIATLRQCSTGVLAQNRPGAGAMFGLPSRRRRS